jgi:hypothetical protein
MIEISLGPLLASPLAIGDMAGVTRQSNDDSVGRARHDGDNDISESVIFITYHGVFREDRVNMWNLSLYLSLHLRINLIPDL